MPLYEYRCSTCEAVVERQRPQALRDLTPRCPTLTAVLSRGGVLLVWHVVRRVITAPAIRGAMVARS